MRYAYFPGCSLHCSAREYSDSTLNVFDHLGIELLEIEDWSCCGSTPAHMTNELLSVALPLSSLFWAQDRDLVTTTPCAACFSAFKTAIWRWQNEPDLKLEVNKVLEGRYSGAGVRHTLEIVVKEYGLDRLKEKVRNGLAGLRVAAYYGCLLTRPPKVKQFDDPEDPMMMDNLVAVLGGEPVMWSHKTVCCGASFALTASEIVEKLSFEILSKAKKAGAECLVVACPLCQSNLDLRQPDIESRYEVDLRLPVFYYTQLLGIALGLDPEAVALDGNIIEPWSVLEAKGIASR